MAITKTYTIPDELVPELIECFGESWTEKVINENGELIDNPDSKAMFASKEFDRQVKEHIKNIVVRYRAKIQNASLNRTFNIQEG